MTTREQDRNLAQIAAKIRETWRIVNLQLDAFHATIHDMLMVLVITDTTGRGQQIASEFYPLAKTILGQ